MQISTNVRSFWQMSEQILSRVMSTELVIISICPYNNSELCNVLSTQLMLIQTHDIVSTAVHIISCLPLPVWQYVGGCLYKLLYSWS